MVGFVAHIYCVVIKTMQGEELCIRHNGISAAAYRCTTIILIVFHPQQRCLCSLWQIGLEAMRFSGSFILCGADSKLISVVDNIIYEVVRYVIVQDEL